MSAHLPSAPSGKKPLISVILDNYNYAQYLPEALASVSSQTYRDFELILVDDGSTDDSCAILQNFAQNHAGADFGIKLILQENGGQSAALNAGFLQCTGDIICFLDSDDVWFPNKLEKIVHAHFDQNMHVPVSSSSKNGSSTKRSTHFSKMVNHIVHHVETIDFADNPALSMYAAPSDPKPYARVLTGVDWHKALMQYGYMCHHSSCSSMSYSREILNRVLPLVSPEKMRFCTDTVIFTCCLSLTKMYKLDEVLSYYRIHGNNFYAGQYSGRRDRKLTEEIRSYCNFQCAAKGLPPIPFHPTRYFAHLLSDFCESYTTNDPVIAAAQKRPLAIYGTASAGKAFYAILQKKSVPVRCFVDSNPERQGTVLFGLPVISPDEIRERNLLVLVASWASRDITEKLQASGLVENQDYITFCL